MEEVLEHLYFRSLSKKYTALRLTTLSRSSLLSQAKDWKVFKDLKMEDSIIIVSVRVFMSHALRFTIAQSKGLK